MVRAAVSGAVDYARADPLDNRWRIKHRLVIAEMQRRENQHMLEYLHQHWCAYVAHGGLEESSFTRVKKSASEILTDLQNTVFPWNSTAQQENEKTGENIAENSKIDNETQKLVDRYKIWREQKSKK